MNPIRSLLRIFFAVLLLAQPTFAGSPLLAKVRAGGNVKICLLGTSLTQAGSWPGSLQTWLNGEAPGPGTVTVINRAASGKASDHGVSTQTPAALNDLPDAVFIEFSMNDAASSLNITKQQARDNLNWMIDQFVTLNPDVIIVLQTMNSLPPDTSPFSPRNDLDGYYQIYRDVAAERGAILIDHYPNWLNLYNTAPVTWQGYMKDAVHPNAAGQANILMPELVRVLDSGTDATPPTLAGADIADDKAGGPVSANSLVTYTLTFSEDMNAASLGAGDFSNAGTSAITLGAIIRTAPGVFTVQVTPTTLGTLQLQIHAGAVLTDLAGNPLDTNAAIPDGTILDVDSTNAVPVWLDEPITGAEATAGIAYASTLAGQASDPDGDPLVYAKVVGPAWLTVAANGTLGGTPGGADAGNNSFTVSVSDGIAAPVTATLNITVAGILPPVGNFLVAWDDWLNVTGSNTAPDDIGVPGFTANVVSGRNLANSAYGSTDGTYGSSISGASTTNVRALLPNSASPNTTVTITNSTGEDYTIDSFHFDFVQRYNALRDITVTYVSGGLGPAATQIFSASYATIGGASTTVVHNYDFHLSEVLSDTVLADGESATFLIVMENSAGSNSSYLDNMAFQGGAAEDGGLQPTLSGFSYNPATGDCVVSIKGPVGKPFKLVEASGLDFSIAERDPIPLTGASVGELEGDTVITTAEGDGTVEFSLGTAKSATFFRAEIVP